jgi:hypothetical protein
VIAALADCSLAALAGAINVTWYHGRNSVKNRAPDA